jgi:hypothetical protein
LTRIRLASVDDTEVIAAYHHHRRVHYEEDGIGYDEHVLTKHLD